MQLQPGVCRLELPLRPVACDDEQHERDGQRQQRDDREEDPVDDVLGPARIELRDVLQRDRDECAGVRQGRARADDRDRRRLRDLANLLHRLFRPR